MEKQRDVVLRIKTHCSEITEFKSRKHFDDIIYTKSPKDVDNFLNDPYYSGRQVDDALFDEFFKQARLSSNEPGGYRDFLASDCLRVIGNRQIRAEEMRTEGGDLAQWVSYTCEPG